MRSPYNKHPYAKFNNVIIQIVKGTQYKDEGNAEKQLRRRREDYENKNRRRVDSLYRADH